MEEVQGIEIQPLLVALAVTVVIMLAVSVLFLYCPSSSSYERQFGQKEQTSEGTDVPKLQTKTEKKQKKKLKKKDQKGHNSKLLQLEIDAQVMGEDIPLSDESVNNKKGKKKSKSILLNKDEPVNVTKETIEYPHVRVEMKPPADEIELHHKEQQVHSQESSSVKVEEVMQSSSANVYTAAPPESKKKKKANGKKREHSLSWESKPRVMGVDPPPSGGSPRRSSILVNKDEAPQVLDGTVSYSHRTLPAADEVELEHRRRGEGSDEVSETDLTRTIREAVLTQVDVERLINLLLEKTTDPMKSLPQQVSGRSEEYIERELRKKAEERREQLERDLSRVKAKSQQRESEAASANEKLSELQARLQKTTTQYEQTQTRLQETYKSQMTRLQDENQKLTTQIQERSALLQASQKELKVMQSSLSDSVMKMNTNERARQAAEARLKQVEKHQTEDNPAVQKELQSLRAQFASLQQELITSKQALEKADASRQQVSLENARLSQDIQNRDLSSKQVLQQTVNERNSLQTKVKDLEVQLHLQQEASRRELASHKQTSSNEEQDKRRREVELQQMSSSREELEQKLQRAEEQTQRAMADMQSKLDRQVAEMSEISVEREQQAVVELSSLHTQITTLRTQLSMTSQSLVTAEDALHHLQQEKNAVNSEKNQLLEQLAILDRDNKTRESQTDELKKRVADVTSELDHSRTTANEFREELWRLKEEMSRMAQDRDEQISTAQKQQVSTALDVERAEFRAVFQRAFPQLKQLAYMTHDDWLKEFPLQVIQLKKVQPDTKSDRELQDLRRQLKETESSNVDLQHKSSELQSLLSTTEKALSQLAERVESELKLFERKLAEKDVLIAQVEKKLSEAQKPSQKASSSDELEKQLSEMTAELSATQIRCNNLQSQLDSVTVERIHLQTQFDLAQKQICTLAQIEDNGTTEPDLDKRRDSSCSSDDDGPINTGLKGIVDDVLTKDL